jgi:hypothetical protein
MGYAPLAMTLSENDSGEPAGDAIATEPDVLATSLVLPELDGGATLIAAGLISTVMVSLPDALVSNVTLCMWKLLVYTV